VRNTFAQTMLDVGSADPRLVVLVGDISHFALQPFAKACPGRFYNVGILEPTIVNMAAGLAIAGLLPVVHTITPFLIERSFEQIKLDFCYQELGGTLISVGSAFDYSGLGCSHHCYDDLGLIKSLPNTVVIYPASPREFVALFRQTYGNGKLTYFRLPGSKHGVELPEEAIVLGKGIRVKAGRDVTVLASGPQLKTAMAAVPILQAESIDPEVLYFPTLKPFDEALVRDSAARTKRLLAIEEHSRYGGLGDEVLRATRDVSGVRSRSIDIPDRFQRGYGQYEEHLQALGFTPENVANECRKLLREED
jgi:transketolase